MFQLAKSYLIVRANSTFSDPIALRMYDVCACADTVHAQGDLITDWLIVSTSTGDFVGDMKRSVYACGGTQIVLDQHISHV